jgi:hypothetical protein
MHLATEHGCVKHSDEAEEMCGPCTKHRMHGHFMSLAQELKGRKVARQR